MKSKWDAGPIAQSLNQIDLSFTAPSILQPISKDVHAFMSNDAPETGISLPSESTCRVMRDPWSILLAIGISANVFWLVSFTIILDNDADDFNANMARSLHLLPEPRTLGGPRAWVSIMLGCFALYLSGSLAFQRAKMPIALVLIQLLCDATTVLFPFAISAIFVWLSAIGAYSFALWTMWLAFYGPIVHCFLIVPLCLAGGVIARQCISLQSTTYRKAALVLSFAALSLLLLLTTRPEVIRALGGVPLVPEAYNLDWRESKPKLFAHGGGRSRSPENTKTAFEIAAENDQVVGLESDVVLSAEWKPYLMHDCRCIGRTTDAFRKFPADLAARPCFEWSWEELALLDAGAWYSEQFAGQRIPAFADLLNVAKLKGKKVIVDLKYGTSGPYAAFVTLKEISAQGMADHFIWLDYGYDDWINTYAPVFDYFHGLREKMIFGVNILEPSLFNATLARNEINVTAVVADYGTPLRTLRFYKALGMEVYAYTVNRRWLFSAIWMAGLVDYVMTDDAEALGALATPILWEKDSFNRTAVGFYVAGAAFVVVLSAFPARSKGKIGADGVDQEKQPQKQPPLPSSLLTSHTSHQMIVRMRSSVMRLGDQ